MHLFLPPRSQGGRRRSYWLTLLLFTVISGHEGKIYIEAAFGACSSLCFICTHTHTHTQSHTHTFSVHPFCTYVSGREQGPVSLRQSRAQNPICFERNNSSPYEQPADAASACPRTLVPYAVAKMVTARVDRARQFTPGHEQIKSQAEMGWMCGW